MFRVFSFLAAVSLLFISCQRQEDDRQPSGKLSGKNSGIGSSDLFFNGDSGQNLKLSRAAGNTASTGTSVPTGNYLGQSTYANYGYGQQNPFLAFADYIHWLDYSVMSVVKLHFGHDPSVITIQQVQDHCWNFEVTSSKSVAIARIDDRAAAGYGSMTESTQNAFNVQWTVENTGRAGVIFAVYSSDHSSCDADSLGYYDYTNPNWYHSSNDPYSYGYNGYYGSNYYYYPSYPCAYRHQSATLRVRGTVQTCGTTATGVAQSFDVDLSSYLTHYPGYLPYYKQQVGGAHLIQGRAVNFDGDDWY